MFFKFKVSLFCLGFLLSFFSSRAGEFLRKQTGTTTIAGGSSSSVVAIPIEVDMSKSFLIFSSTLDGNQPAFYQVGGEITSSTSMTFERTGTTGTVSIKWQIIEFDGGVYVQHGSSLNVAQDATTDVTINCIDLTKSFVITSARKSGSTYGNDDGYTADLTTSTNLQFNTNGGAGGGNVEEIYWQVIEYQAAIVKKVTATLIGTSTTSDLTAQTGSPVTDLSKTFVVSNHRQNGNLNADNLPRTELTSTNVVTYTRVGSANTLDFVTYVVELTDGSTVSRGTRNFLAGETSLTTGITATTSSCVIGPGNFGRQGSTSYSATDNVGYGWFTYEIINPTTLQLDRAIGTGQTADAPWQIVTFEDTGLQQDTFYSLATGDWEDNTSWSFSSDGSTGAVPTGVFPNRRNNVVIRNTHTITVDAIDDNAGCNTSPDDLGSAGFTSSNVDMFYQQGEIIIDNGGTLTITTRHILGGFTYVNGTLNSNADIVNFGNLEVTSSGTFSTGDDLILSGNSLTTLDNTTNGFDDLYIDGPDALLCGSGILNVGNGGPDPVIQYLNGASSTQVCSSITIQCVGTPAECSGFSAPSPTGSFSLGFTGPGGVGDESNVGMWFKADDLSGTDGSTVPTWADASGNGNDATQGTAGREPLFYNTSSMNNMPIVRFDGGNDEMTVADADILDNTDGLTLIVALRPANLDGSPRGILGKRLNSGTAAGYSYTWFFFTSNYLNIDIDTQNDRFNTNPTAYGNATNYILSLIYDGTLAAANRANIYEEETNVVTASESSASIPNGGTVLTLGALNASYGTYLGADYGDVIQMNVAINNAERIIINNYLSAKYNIALSANEVYEMDDAGNGDFDFEVAGIGQATDGTFNKDAKGTGLVRMSLANDLDNNEYLLWGHDGTDISTVNTVDVDNTVIEARLERVWRISENDNTGTAVDVGTVRLTFDAQDLPASIVGSDIRLLITRDDALFADNDVTPKAGSYNVDNQLITFSNVSFQDGDYFTLGTIDNTTSPLPIDLIYFTAKPSENDHVKLEWATASEENNDYFTIERSENSIEWEVVTTLNGKGSDNQRNEYYSIDDRPYPGISYYRLKQTDFDGTFTYSPIKSVQIELTQKINIYPNPSRGSFTIKTGFELENASIQVIDLTGRYIQSSVTKEQFSAEVNLVNSPSGIYILELRDGIRVYKYKVLIDH